MRFLGASALIACVSSSALAAPITTYSGWHVEISMKSVVTSVDGGGKLYGPDGYIRDFSIDEIANFAWSVGDRFEMRWRIRPKDKFNCLESYEHLQFGGTTLGGDGGDGASGMDAGCGAGPAAYYTKLKRADGTTAIARDGWESGYGEGPVFNLRTGELELNYQIVDGLATWDCCFYHYDPKLDQIFGTPGPGTYAGVYAFLYGEDYLFELGDMYDPSAFWIELDGSRVSYSQVWRYRVIRTPEPATFILFGLGLLAFGLTRRRQVMKTTRA